MFDFTLRQARLKTEYKVTILGYSKVGKSAMVTRLMEHETFLAVHQETLIDILSQQMFMLDKDGQRTREVTLHIKDVGHKFIQKDCLADQDAYVICYDITDESSFYGISDIVKLLQEIFIEEGKTKPLVFAGLKSDLAHKRQVSFQDGERTAEAYQAPYLECSSKDNSNVEDIFDQVLTQIYKQERKEGGAKQRQVLVKIEDTEQKQEKACCTIF